jgi:hypothetical protein
VDLIPLKELFADTLVVIAGFMTGGALAVRGGWKAARNSAITCGILLAVIEGVGIGIQRLMADNVRLDVSSTSHLMQDRGVLIVLPRHSKYQVQEEPRRVHHRQRAEQCLREEHRISRRASHPR